MSLAGFHFREGTFANLFDRDDIDNYPGVILPPPLRGKDVDKPLIELRQKVGPLGDSERLLAFQGTQRKMEEGAERGRINRQLEEIAPRTGSGHLGYPVSPANTFI